MKSLQFVTDEGYNVYIPLFSGNTILLGNNGTGKSYVYEALKKASSERKLKFDCACFDNNNCTAMLHTLNSDYKGLIVLENFDILRVNYPELIPLLQEQSHQVLLIGRCVDNIPRHMFYVFELVRKGRNIGVKALVSPVEFYKGDYML